MDRPICNACNRRFVAEKKRNTIALDVIVAHGKIAR